MLFYEFGFELRRIYDLRLHLLGPNAGVPAQPLDRSPVET
jgi:hypothetical protein